MITTQPIVAPHDELRLRLWAESTVLEREMIAQIQALAPLLSSLSPSQLRGVVNALAPGPERRTPIERRQALAYYLAWRRVRATADEEAMVPTTMWATVADQLVEALRSIEQTCTMLLEQAARRVTYWQQEPAALAAYRQQLLVETNERFLYLLIRHVTSAQAAPASATTTEGDSHDDHRIP